MNKTVTFGLIMSILLIAGLLSTPDVTGYTRMEARAQKTILTKSSPAVKNVALIADEVPVQTATLQGEIQVGKRPSGVELHLNAK